MQAPDARHNHGNPISSSIYCVTCSFSSCVVYVLLLTLRIMYIFQNLHHLSPPNPISPCAPAERTVPIRPRACSRTTRPIQKTRVGSIELTRVFENGCLYRSPMNAVESRTARSSGTMATRSKRGALGTPRLHNDDELSGFSGVFVSKQAHGFRTMRHNYCFGPFARGGKFCWEFRLDLYIYIYETRRFRAIASISLLCRNASATTPFVSSRRQTYRGAVGSPSTSSRPRLMYITVAPSGERGIHE